MESIEQFTYFFVQSFSSKKNIFNSIKYSDGLSVVSPINNFEGVHFIIYKLGQFMLGLLKLQRLNSIIY